MIKNGKLKKYKVKKIIKCFCIDINATKTASLLGLNRKTINRYFNLFRRSIYINQMKEFEKFVGEIEIDESYFGSTRRRGVSCKLKRGRGTQKQPVFGIFQRNGFVYTEIISNCKKETLQKIIRGRVSLNSVINTDGWKGYDGLVDIGYDKHFRVKHGKNEFVRKGGVHINGIENFWSFTKGRLAKFNGVKVNFALHLKECEWRYKKDHLLLEQQLTKLLKYV